MQQQKSVGAGRRKSSLKTSLKTSDASGAAPKRQTSAKTSADDTPAPKRQTSARLVAKASSGDASGAAPKRQNSAKTSADDAPVMKRKSSGKGLKKADSATRPGKRIKVNGTVPNAVSSPAGATAAGVGASGSSSAWGGGQLPLNALLSQVASAGLTQEMLANLQPNDVMNLVTMLQAANKAGAAPAVRTEPVVQAADVNAEAALALRASVGLAGAASAERHTNQHPAGLDVGEPISVSGELTLWSGKVRNGIGIGGNLGIVSGIVVVGESLSVVWY